MKLKNILKKYVLRVLVIVPIPVIAFYANESSVSLGSKTPPKKSARPVAICQST